VIIGLLGFMGSGKGTAGEILAEEKGFISLSFADSLKDATSVIFGWDRTLLEGDTTESREFRETVDEFWTKKFGKKITPRYILQYFGTEVCRSNLISSIWVDSLERKILQHENVVVTDVRFNNEITFLKGLNSTLIQVDREQSRPKWYEYLQRWDKDTFKSYAILNEIHKSEYEWVGNEFIDHIVQNDGSFGDLELKLLNILENN
jgi:adenylate kinase family enzyme